MPKRIVIIGGGTSGASAAFSARKHDRTAEVTIIDRESHSTYSRCGLPFAIKGVINPIENLVVFAPKIFASQKITQKLATEVTGINHQTREVTYKSITTGEAGKVNYDALIFATGSTPSKPPIGGIDGPNVRVLRTIDDAKNIISSAKSVQSVVVIGASFIGLEVAEALKHLGLDVTVIEQRYLLWRMLDKEISQMARQKLTDHGIKLIEDKSISDLNEYKDSLVIISTGVRPSVKLAKDMGVTIGTTGGIKVDKTLRTNLPDVYAVGDCAEAVSDLTGQPIVIGLGTIAARQGVVAGANAAGKPCPDEHRDWSGAPTGAHREHETGPAILNASVLKLLDMEIGSVGMTEFGMASAECGFNPISALIKFPSLPHYYPGGTDVHVKLIADKATKRIIGGQVMCSSGAALRVNMISLAIQNKMTIADILKSDFCYSPPVTDVWEPVMIAAQGVAAKLSRP
ncbi:MAG: FAD-dependent oxidoreductase [Planctomycetes bacterium]|nr:FAD-dependent oxidoreductase [Planctomycetota bacterium]